MKRVALIVLTLMLIVSVQAKLVVLSETDDQVTFEFHLGDYSIIETSGFSFVATEGLGYRSETGAPMLPEITYYLAIPENGRVIANTISADMANHHLPHHILPVPETIRGEKGSEDFHNINEGMYRTRSGSLISTGEPFVYRYNHVIPLTIAPVSYNYTDKSVEVAERIEINVTITGNTSLHNQEYDSLNSSAIIVNHESSLRWQTLRRVNVEHAKFNNSDFWYKFEVNQNGMYELNYSNLSALPIDDIDPRTIRIFTTGGALLTNSVNNAGNPFAEIPLMIIGEENGTFDSTDRIIFYAENRDGFEKNSSLSGTVQHYFNPFSGNGVYWLTFGGNFSDPPRRMVSANYPNPQTARDSGSTFYHFETESTRMLAHGFNWFHAILSDNHDSNHNYSFSAKNVDTTKQQKLTVTLQNDRNTESGTVNSLTMRVNNNTVIDRFNWSGTAYRTFSGTGNFMTGGTNNVTMTIHRNRSSSVYFDYFKIDYYRLLVKENEPLSFGINEDDNNIIVEYKIAGSMDNLFAFETDGTHQTSLLALSQDSSEVYDFSFVGRGSETTKYHLVKSGEFLTVSNFREVIPQDLTFSPYPVDVIIISPEAFLSHAETLADLYFQEEGFNTKIANQQDIFNQFNGGMPDPNAIRLFLRHAFYNYPSNGNSSLQNVVVLGSGTIDWRNFSGQAAQKNKIMMFQIGSETSDDYYVDLSGNGVPQIGIGRITAQDENQANTILTKITNYWLNPTPGTWKNRPLIVADDEFTTRVANEAIHSVQTQTISRMLSPGVETDKLFALEYPFDSFGNKPTARNELIARLNEGRLIWYYIGHGAYDLMGHESYFRTTDIQSLNNAEKLPLFIAASCDVGKFDYFAYDSLSERLLAYPHGGSIASLAATGLSSPSPNASLMERFLPLLINNHIPPGIALMQAKNLASGQIGNNRRYAYMGDPILPISAPERAESITIQSDPDSLSAYQTVQVSGTFSEPSVTGVAKLSAYSPEKYLTYTVHDGSSTFTYSKMGNPYFRGQNQAANSEFNGSFVVPGDIPKGEEGRILSYIYDNTTKRDFVSYYYPITYSNIPYQNADIDSLPPEVTVWLDDPSFRDGDTVSQNPVFYASLSDESGINILGELGHKLLLVMDRDSEIVDVTSGFIYDIDSHTSGTLSWQLTDLKEGSHQLQLVVFDNHNNYKIASTYFNVTKSEEISISNMLPYPNPMSDSGHFTFTLSNSANVVITIYTIRGRSIKTIRTAANRGFNKIFWDGRDAEGDRLANNTYLYKIRASDVETGKATEKIGKVVILR